jgi:glycerol uptake facilitator-like aquaporin
VKKLSHLVFKSSPGCGFFIVESKHKSVFLFVVFILNKFMILFVLLFTGAHINPAVSLAMLVTRRVSLLRGIMFIAAQCGGGIAGAALLYG